MLPTAYLRTFFPASQAERIYAYVGIPYSFAVAVGAGLKLNNSGHAD